MKNILIFLIRFYQRFLSPLKIRSSCIFFPTCSQYAVEALQTHGVIFGLGLAAWRILRCNPFNSHGGYDPVPEKISFPGFLQKRRVPRRKNK